eukprot:6193584-Pleurochrysis_carterae.AAC.9
MAAWKANAALTKERDALASELRGHARRADRFDAVASRALQWQMAAECAAQAVSQRKQTMASYRTAIAKVEKIEVEKRPAESKLKDFASRRQKINMQLRAASSSSGSATSRLQHMRKDLAAASTRFNTLTAEHNKALAKISELKSKLEEVKLMYDTSINQLQEYTAKLDNAERRADVAERQFLELKEASRDVGGRSRGHAGRDRLERRWNSTFSSARRSAFCRHASDIQNALLDAGFEDWVPSCLALTLQILGLMDFLLRTKIVARQRFELVLELAGILPAE